MWTTYSELVIPLSLIKRVGEVVLCHPHPVHVPPSHCWTVPNNLCIMPAFVLMLLADTVMLRSSVTPLWSSLVPDSCWEMCPATDLSFLQASCLPSWSKSWWCQDGGPCVGCGRQQGTSGGTLGPATGARQAQVWFEVLLFHVDAWWNVCGKNVFLWAIWSASFKREGKNMFSESRVHVWWKECWLQICEVILTLLGMLEPCKLSLKRENNS